MTRRTAVGTVVGTAGLAAAEYVLSKSLPIVKAALPVQRPKNNILLISFDIWLQKTCRCTARPFTHPSWMPSPTSTVFSRFYSGSTTTPSIATMLTGLLSESKVYQYGGGRRHAKCSCPSSCALADMPRGRSFPTRMRTSWQWTCEGDLTFCPSRSFIRVISLCFGMPRARCTSIPELAAARSSTSVSMSGGTLLATYFG